jgi:response regulator of citrate/malate metabolism
MITVLVVDDDFRVAHVHAASVERVEGFRCVGEAHSAAQAREMIRGHQPDLLILDIYLPDESGLSLLRSLAAEPQPPPDCIFITAARDVESVRSAIGLGAVYYLVKPFGLQQLIQQLEAYRRWRQQLAEAAGEADQNTIDSFYALRRPARLRASHPELPPTMSRVLQIVKSAEEPVSAEQVASRLGISRPTAQRYLSELTRRSLLHLELEYGTTGRPVHRYRSPGQPR